MKNQVRTTRTQNRSLVGAHGTTRVWYTIIRAPRFVSASDGRRVGAEVSEPAAVKQEISDVGTVCQRIVDDRASGVLLDIRRKRTVELVPD